MFISRYRSLSGSRGQHGRCSVGSQLTFVTLSLVLAVGLGAVRAHAGIPELTLGWWVNDVEIFNGAVTGTGNGAGFTYQGDIIGGGAWLTYGFTGNPDPLIAANLVVENITNETIEVRLVVLLPVAPVLPGTGMTGSAGIGLTADPFGGVLMSLPGTPVWQALIDGTPVGPLASFFHDPFMLEIDNGIGSVGESANFGNFIPVAGPPVLETIGIQVSFSLTPGDQAGLTSVFRVVPAPGGLMVLIGAALFRRRRRRLTI